MAPPLKYSELPELKVRKIAHDFKEDTPRYWVKGNPVLTHFYNALSTVIPEGEKFFIHSIMDASEHLSDVELQEQVKAFVSQEGNHLQGHGALNNLLVKQGYPLKENESRIKAMLVKAKNKFSAKKRLAITLGLEHFAAMLTDQFLRQPGLYNDMDPQISEFLVWHCIEEIEHKAVAYDVYQEAYGDYSTRALQMLYVTFWFLPKVAGIQLRYLAHDKELLNIRAWLGAFSYFWFRPAWFRRIFFSYFKYYHPGFHPWDEDNRGLLKSWIDKLSAS